jgi:hypothetical protein
MYYLRTKSAVDANQGLGMDVSKLKELESREMPITKKEEVIIDKFDSNTLSSDISCSLDDPDNCLACGS